MEKTLSRPPDNRRFAQFRAWLAPALWYPDDGVPVSITADGIGSAWRAARDVIAEEACNSNTPLGQACDQLCEAAFEADRQTKIAAHCAEVAERNRIAMNAHAASVAADRARKARDAHRLAHDRYVVEERLYLSELAARQHASQRGTGVTNAGADGRHARTPRSRRVTRPTSTSSTGDPEPEPSPDDRRAELGGAP